MLSTHQVHSLLCDLKRDLRESLGDNLVDLVLFGSYSRGDYVEGSDIDLLILVEMGLTRGDNVAVDDLVSRYSLRYDIVISALVYTVRSYHEIDMPFFQNIREDGIRI
jgi:predicted nucleotidyltransferase